MARSLTVPPGKEAHHLECGGKRSATPLWLTRTSAGSASVHRTPKPKRRRRCALPAHSIGHRSAGCPACCIAGCRPASNRAEWKVGWQARRSPTGSRRNSRQGCLRYATVHLIEAGRTPSRMPFQAHESCCSMRYAIRHRLQIEASSALREAPAWHSSLKVRAWRQRTHDRHSSYPTGQR